MAASIDKNDATEKIRETIRKAAEKRKKHIDLGRYFGKVNFGVDGLKYQKTIRDEWK